MFKLKSIAIAVAFACASQLPAQAYAQTSAQNGELGSIRSEIKQMRELYENRIQELEKRLSEAEAKVGKAETAAVQAQTNSARAENSAAAAVNRSGENAFNPAISLIMQGTFAKSSQNPNQYQLTGFAPTGGEVGPPKRSFGLAETELAISANIDPYFRGIAIAAIAPEGGIEIEEGYVQTLALPSGLTFKAGRYFSGIGYQNEQHQHAWDFQDAPLVYKAFLGNKLKQDGVQLKWIAPTDLLLETGVELSSGDKFPGSDRNKNGVGGSSVFANLGGDLGASTAWRVGTSYLTFAPNGRSYTDTDSAGGEVTNTFSGNAKMWGLNGVLKWAPNGNARASSFKLQGEYFRLKQDGSLNYNDSANTNAFGSVTSSLSTDQSGYYLQGIWQFQPGWRAGYRYDTLRYGTVNNGVLTNGLGPTAADMPVLASHSPTRNTLMVDWSPSEFSRFRLQFASDKSRLGVTDNQMILQYIHSLGAHGAHKF